MLENVRPVFKKLLAAAVAAYVIGTAMLLSDLCRRVGTIEHGLLHAAGKCPVRHQ